MYQLIKDPFTGQDSTKMIKKIDEQEISFIPLDPKNSDCRVYLAWLAASNAPLPSETL